MDELDHLNEHARCGLCCRLIPYSDDFCTQCRRVAGGVALDPAPVLEAELITLAAAS